MRAKTRFIALIILPVFLTTNSIYANSFKLAAATQAGGLGMLSSELRVPAGLLSAITARKIADLKALRLEEEKIKDEVIGKYRSKRDSHEITEGEFQQIERDIKDSLSFLSTDSEGKVVIYLFNKNKPYFYRILKSDTEVVDKFYEAFINPEDRVGETINIDGYSLEVYVARMDRIDGITRCLYELYGEDILLGRLNVLNGGKHADNNVDIQATQIVPIAENALERNIIARRVYAALLALLKKRGLNTNVGDEGGFAPKVKSNEEYLRLLEEAIENAGYEPGKDVAIALDPAASEFSYKVAGKIVYVLRGESAPVYIGGDKNIGRIQKGTADDGRPYDGLVLTTDEMVLYWAYLINKYPIVSIENGFSEDDVEGFRLLTKAVEQAGVKHGPIAKKVRQGEPETNIWEAGLRGGKLVDAKVLNENMAGRVDTALLQKVLDSLGSDETYRGAGIFLGVDVIRVVDNLQEGQVEGIVPFTMIKQEGNNRVLLLDVDSFKNEALLHLVVDHELIEGIMTLIPYESEAIRELTSNYLSVLVGLNKAADYISDVDSLDPDNRFFGVIRYVRERKLEGNRKAIIGLLLEHMRTTPYYRDLAKQLGVTEGLAGQIDAATNRFEKALEVFNSIAEALEPRVEETAVKTRRFIKMGEKVKMVTSQLISKEIGIVDALVREGKYIRLDIDELEKHPELLGWVKGLLEKKDKSPFIFYSSSGKAIPRDLRQADVKEMTQQNTITLIEPERITSDMPQDTLYLPLPYARSTVYLASEVVLAGGVVDNIDKLAKNTIESLYSALLGRDVTDTDLEQLFRYPWTILPEIASISATLDAIRTAIARIEAAA